MKKLALLMVALLAVACAGVKAREQALMPAMQLAFVGVSADALRGIQAREQANPPTITPEEAKAIRLDILDLTSALERRDRAAALEIPWVAIIALAEDGIRARLASGEIGPKVAEKLEERVRLLNKSFLELGAR